MVDVSIAISPDHSKALRFVCGEEAGGTVVETQGEKRETRSSVSTGNRSSHRGCRTAQKLHCAHTPPHEGGEPPLQDLAGECYSRFGDREVSE